jgi:hypothetical protein
MSIKIMTQIWEAGPSDMGERFVLLAIADHANDDGLAYPSGARIAKKTCMDERSVRRITKRLVDAGWLRVEYNAGPRGCNLFTVTAPDLKSPGPTVPLTDGPQTPDPKSGDPLTDGPPNHHLTTNEPSEASQASPAPSRLGKRLSEDWTPSEKNIEYAISKGLDQNEIDRIAEDFADYWIGKPGKDGRKANWDRTWQKWIRTEVDRLSARVGKQSSRSGAEVARDAARRAVDRQLRGA